MVSRIGSFLKKFTTTQKASQPNDGDDPTAEQAEGDARAGQQDEYDSFEPYGHQATREARFSGRGDRQNRGERADDKKRKAKEGERRVKAVTKDSDGNNVVLQAQNRQGQALTDAAKSPVKRARKPATQPQ